MEPACIRHTDLPGTSRLFADFSYHFDRVAPFFRHAPEDPGSFAAAVREIDYPEARRAAMVAALAAQNGPSESLKMLARPGTVAVVTGQQVGLFCGPAYTVYKALTAIRVARDLTAQRIAAVPIFWLASEDHDFAEAAVFHGFDASYRPTRLELKAPKEAEDRPCPVGNLRIENAPLGELRQMLAGFPHGDDVFALVKTAYANGATMTQAFRTLLNRLLPDSGLLTLDPMDPKIRSIAAPFLADALTAAPDLKADLLKRGNELSAAGYHPQVLVEPKSSLFFLLENGERVTLRRKDSDFAALRDRAADVSPNALLRPVMQDYLLPTAAFIGGPAEVAYLAQSQVVYDRLLGRMPVVLARASFTLLESRTAKLLERYKLSIPETLVNEDALKERLASALVPSDIEHSFIDAAGELDRRLTRLSGELERFDHSLAAALAKSRAKMTYQLEKIRRKTAREILRRDVNASDGAEHLSNVLFPHRHLQERFYSILPFLAEHGLDLPARLLESLTLACPDHRVVRL